jgi:sugar transferase EpsL
MGSTTAKPRPLSTAKQVLDRAAALVLLVLLSPILLLIAIAVGLSIGSPILFRQQRPGLYGKPFMLLKFRTMTDRRDEQGTLLPDAQRMTRFGNFLRHTSLDELPELFNILRGDMSLVGPRPLLMEYLERYSPEQSRRHEVMPGVTGWAQVNGRNAIAWEEKFKLDVWYVDHRSLWLDLRIIALTAWRILRREGITQPGHATAEVFQGTKATGSGER